MNQKYEDKIKIESLKTIGSFVEYVGTLRQVEIQDHCVTIFLSYDSHGESKLIFSILSSEAKSLAEQLEKLIGRNVGILKTDDLVHPYRIRVISPGEHGS
jgi:hypothetical protein